MCGVRPPYMTSIFFSGPAAAGAVVGVTGAVVVVPVDVPAGAAAGAVGLPVTGAGLDVHPDSREPIAPTSATRAKARRVRPCASVFRYFCVGICIDPTKLLRSDVRIR